MEGACKCGMAGKVIGPCLMNNEINKVDSFLYVVCSSLPCGFFRTNEPRDKVNASSILIHDESAFDLFCCNCVSAAQSIRRVGQITSISYVRLYVLIESSISG